ncbi:MAG: aldo/keto reductase [Chloroflexi bacterium]|nr:aldo/keto reductase [Chloroflexota bacterium]
MEYRNLGRSGLKISEIGLGSDTFGRSVDERNSIAIVNHALDLGINFIDTADIYGGQGRSEEFVGKAVKGKRHQVIIATKFSGEMGSGPNDRGGSRYHIINAVDASLKRLNTDYIDLYQMHRPDPTAPIDETLRALDVLVRAGKVRYVGASNFAAWQLCEAIWVSRRDRLESFITVQPKYNLIDRTIEQELVPFCRAYGVGIIPWYPLAAGFLTGKYRRGEAPAAGTRFASDVPFYSRLLTDINFVKLDKLEAFAKERGHAVSELAIAWLLAHPWISAIIPGATTVEQISANAAAARWKLTADELSQIDRIAPA